MTTAASTLQFPSSPLHGARQRPQRLQARLLAQRALLQRLRTRSTQQTLQAGFTLIELLIVVIIIGVLAAIALPSFLNQQGRSRVVSGQAAAMDAARACAALVVTSNHADFTNPTGITGTCSAAGTASAFTATNAAFGTTTPGVATVAADGSVALTQCAAASGWTAGTPPVCTPTKA
jgi:type IV pilus assembly protein PilA